MRRVGLYFFVIASILAIIDGAFKISSPSLQIAKIILLVFSGIIVGLFILSKEKEFLLAGLVFVLSASILLNVLGPYFSTMPIGLMMTNFIIFTSSALVILSFKEIAEYVSSGAEIENEIQKHITLDHLKEDSFEKIWGIVILVAVCVSILQLLLEIFYDISNYILIFEITDAVITALFLVDLVILYEQTRKFKTFLKKNYFDIIAAIPSVGFLRLLKITRAVRIIHIFKATSKLSKFLKVTKTTKFFSDESSFSTYTKKVDKNTIKEKPKINIVVKNKKVIKKKSNSKK